jgi:hypothetical protein
MTELPIAACRLLIAVLRAGGCFTRCRHDGGEIVRFLQQSRQFAGGQDSGFCEQFKPERRFVRFLFNDPDFGNEFRFASSSARRPVVCGYRSSAADDLFGYNASCIIGFGNRSRKFDDPKREVFGALFQLCGIHARKLRNQSPIANRQSAIIS